MKTLSGEEDVQRPEGLEELEAASTAERAKSQGNTLLGHPPSPSATQTLPGAVAPPVLAPPKWRGAGAYMHGQGDEPQPRISSIPVPPAIAAPTKPVGVPIGVMRSQVKTKIGQPVAQRPAQELQPASEPPPPPPDDTLKDTIQQMLEQQASVPIEVEEAASAEGIPELAMDELLDDEPAAAPAGAPASRSHAAPPDTDTDTERPPASASDPAPQAASAPPEAGGGSERRRKVAVQVAVAAAPDNTPPADGADAAVKKAEPEALPKETAGREPKRRVERRPASSLAPAEVSRRIPRPDAEAKAGILFVAAMVAIGGGGWWLTRGTYHPPMRVQPPPPAPTAAVEPSAPAAPATSVTTPGATTPGATTPAATAPAPALPTKTQKPAAAPEASQPRGARKPRPSDGPAAATPDDQAQPAATPSERSVLTVTPRAEGPQGSAELPDSPTRDNVIATLNALRPAFLECAQGQRGVAQLDITLVDSGAVSHVVVGGDFAGSPQGSCIARAARTAQFAPFKKPRFRLVYPVSL